MRARRLLAGGLKTDRTHDRAPGNLLSTRPGQQLVPVHHGRGFAPLECVNHALGDLSPQFSSRLD